MLPNIFALGLGMVLGLGFAPKVFTLERDTTPSKKNKSNDVGHN